MYFERGICKEAHAYIYIYTLFTYMFVRSFVRLFACLFVPSLSSIHLFVHLFIIFFLYPAGKEHTWRGEEKASFIARRDFQCFPETRMNSGFNYSLSGWEEKEPQKGKQLNRQFQSTQRLQSKNKTRAQTWVDKQLQEIWNKLWGMMRITG